MRLNQASSGCVCCIKYQIVKGQLLSIELAVLLFLTFFLQEWYKHPASVVVVIDQTAPSPANNCHDIRTCERTGLY